MAVAVLLDFAGARTADYDRAMQAMDIGDRLPLSCLFHAAGEGPGGLEIRDVWETAEAFERFAVGRLQPEARRLGLPRPEVRILPVDEIIRGREATIRFMSFLETAEAAAPGEHAVLHVSGPCRSGAYALAFSAVPAGTPVRHYLTGTPVTA